MQTLFHLIMFHLLVGNVPRLSQVSISENCICNNFIEVVFTQLSGCLSYLEILKLTGEEIVSYKRDRVFPILANLKHLELILAEDDASALLQLTCFMRASPCLHRLVLYLKKEYATSKRREIKYKKAPKCFHNHLKVLELVGYVGHTSELELVKFFAKTAVKLEKIVMKGNEEDRWGKMIRDADAQKLKEKLPSTLELVYL